MRFHHTTWRESLQVASHKAFAQMELTYLLRKKHKYGTKDYARFDAIYARGDEWLDAIHEVLYEKDEIMQAAKKQLEAK